MTFVGVLDADLQAASEYKSGGIGPLFRQSRTEEPLSLIEFLSRTIDALRKTKVTSVVTLFLDEIQVFEDAEAKDDNLTAALDAAGEVADSESGISFSLMLTYQDDDLWHVLTIEASVDHPADEAALTVLDTAKWLDEDAEEDEPESDAGEPEEDVDAGPDIIEEDGSNGELLVEAFLQRLLGELHKELALADPEIETWTDWEGQYDPDSYYASALPGLGV